MGLTRDEVNTVLGSLKTDVKRTAKSPQGFDVIAFRAGGNDTDKSFDEKHSTYILIYLKDDIVVGISGNASSMNFDGTVSYGTSGSSLSLRIIFCEDRSVRMDEMMQVIALL